jgi:hypothetical protein
MIGMGASLGLMLLVLIAFLFRDGLLEILLLAGVAYSLGVSGDAAEFIVALVGLCVMMWLAFRSALRDKRLRRYR